MCFDFIQVTEKVSKERCFINTKDISSIRENAKEGTSVISFISKPSSYMHTMESFESFEEFFDEVNSRYEDNTEGGDDA